MTAAIAAAIAVFYAVETITLTGPVLAASGIGLSIATRRSHSWFLLIYSLSAPAVAGVGAAIIWAFTLGPVEAGQPMKVLTVLYAAVMLPASIFAYFQIAKGPRPIIRRRHVWQFSMKSLLIFVTVICVLLTIGRYLLPDAHGNHRDLTGFFAFSAVVFLAITWRVIDFYNES